MATRDCDSLTSDEILRWDAALVRARARRLFTVPANPTVAPTPQRVLLLPQLDREARRLVARLIDKSVDPRRLGRARRRGARGRGEGFLADRPALEVGAFRLRLRDPSGPGELLVAFHSSSETGGIRVDHLLKSLRGVLESRGIDLDRVARLDYFHTHPSRAGGVPDPISTHDEAFLALLRDRIAVSLARVGARPPRIRCYAIGRLEAETVVYELRLPTARKRLRARRKPPASARAAPARAFRGGAARREGR